jgi:hypothetical protein
MMSLEMCGFCRLLVLEEAHAFGGNGGLFVVIEHSSVGCVVSEYFLGERARIATIIVAAFGAIASTIGGLIDGLISGRRATQG